MDRSLPSIDVTPDNITDKYVDFILYCNPQFPRDVDASQLRARFNSAPKSDNKEFQSYRLFQLIKQFDAKEIDTWGQLALDLGVEPPDLSKNQSIQKVQQYTVRLKRWMRAMHIDAFFEYLLGKEHLYFIKIPPVNDPYPASGRDGVLAEEDLAVRALDPSFRPKRGRRRQSPNGQDGDADSIKQPRLAGSITFDDEPASAYPNSAIPMSAHPSGAHDPWGAASAISAQTFAPWQGSHLAPQSAVTPSMPPHMRWADTSSHLTPATPHPMSAIPQGSRAAQIAAAYADEPRSAVTPTSRKRKRHGPAVSSAWPSAHPTGTRPRGRPPATRTSQDGPYSTFPVQAPDDGSSRSGSPLAVSKVCPDASEASEPLGLTMLPPPLADRSPSGPGRPGRLSLQVPQHTGAPVRLATPPRVIVSGEIHQSDVGPRNASYTPDSMPAPVVSIQRDHVSEPAISDTLSFSFHTLKRALASDLLRAEFVGRPQRLSGDEVKRLADAVLDRLNVPRSDDSNARDHVARLTAASWLGLGEHLNVPLGPAVGLKKKVRVTRFRTDHEGYEEIISADENWTGETREVFDVAWSATQGSCRGSFELTGLSLSPEAKSRTDMEDIHDLILSTVVEKAKQLHAPIKLETIKLRAQNHAGVLGGSSTKGSSSQHKGDDDGVDWKAKFRMMEFGTGLAFGEMTRFKESMLEKIMDLFLQ